MVRILVITLRRAVIPVCEPESSAFIKHNVNIEHYIICNNHSVRAEVSKPKATYRFTLRYLRVNGVMNYVMLNNKVPTFGAVRGDPSTSLRTKGFVEP